MRLEKPEAVQYLSLEGGGGKGVTYLGAIRTLEKFKVLPIDITKPGSNQIKGISGASAGAITALLLAMGVTSNKIQEILSKPETFTGFFDGPSVGIYRSVDRNNKPAMKQDSPPGMPPLWTSSDRESIASGGGPTLSPCSPDWLEVTSRTRLQSGWCVTPSSTCTT